MNDHRRDARYKVQLAAHLTVGRAASSLWTDDVSLRGVFLRTDTPPRLRQLVAVRLVLPSRDVALKVHGMAVHVVSVENAGGRTPGVGVQFYALDRDTRRVWEEFVGSLARGAVPADDVEPLTFPSGVPEPIRRRFVRHAAVLDVKLATVDELMRFYTREVSEGGMFVETQLDLAVGSEILVQVAHPETADEFLLAAVVRHRQSSRDLVGVGVEFVGNDRGARDGFLDFVRAGIHVDDEPLFLSSDPKVA